MLRMPQLKLGDKAPDFTLLDQRADKLSLSKARKGHKVLVYFYPKADTPGCTTQACGLRDILRDIGDTAVIGISPDSPTRQAKFDTKYGLGFPLLADEDHAVAEAYGVWKEKSMYGRKYMGIERTTYIIGKDGTITHVFPKVKVGEHEEEVLEALSE